MAGIYGEEYENNVNVMFGPARIAATARKFAELEKASGPYKFGMLAKVLVPKPADWADEYGSTKGYGSWEKHSGGIPKGTSRSVDRRHRVQSALGESAPDAAKGR